MVEDKDKLPADVRLSPDVSASEYSKAYKDLKDYIKDASNGSIETYDKLAEITFPIGSNLKPLIEGKGKVSAENDKNRFVDVKGYRTFINSLWGGIDKLDEVELRATHEPENNCIHISCSTKTGGYELFIPVDTTAKGLFVKQRLPYIKTWGDRGGSLSYNPASKNFKDSPDYLIIYSECLYESVSAILDALPEPR